MPQCRHGRGGTQGHDVRLHAPSNPVGEHHGCKHSAPLVNADAHFAEPGQLWSIERLASISKNHHMHVESRLSAQQCHKSALCGILHDRGQPTHFSRSCWASANKYSSFSNLAATIDLGAPPIILDPKPGTYFPASVSLERGIFRVISVETDPRTCPNEGEILHFTVSKVIP